MKALKSIQGTAVPLNMADIDTDIIIPAQYLTSTSQKGYGRHAFARLRESDEFVLNQEQYKQSPILACGDNFGCGSSREHAVWALQEMGFQAIVSTSFADIFKNNAKKNGLLLIELNAKELSSIFSTLNQGVTEVIIDVSEETIASEFWKYSFDMDRFFKHCLLKGLDEMDYLLSHMDQIEQFKKAQLGTRLFINT